MKTAYDKMVDAAIDAEKHTADRYCDTCGEDTTKSHPCIDICRENKEKMKHTEEEYCARCAECGACINC